MILKRYNNVFNLNFYEIRDFMEKFLRIDSGDYEYIEILPKGWVRIYIHYLIWKNLSKHDYSKFLIINKNENYICSVFDIENIGDLLISRDNMDVDIDLSYFFTSLPVNEINEIYIKKIYSIDIIKNYQARCEDLWEI